MQTSYFLLFVRFLSVLHSPRTEQRPALNQKPQSRRNPESKIAATLMDTETWPASEELRMLFILNALQS